MQKIIAISSNGSELAPFILLHYFKLPHMEQKIRTDAKRLNVHLIINQELIDRMIREELENEQKNERCLQERPKWSRIKTKRKS